MSEAPMQVPLPVRENKINWNTAISLGGFIIVVSGMIWTGGSATERWNAAEAKMIAYEAENREKQKVTETRLATLESENRKLDNLMYRLSIVEQNNADTIKNLSDLAKALNEQSTDIKVIREILSRLDQNRNSHIK